MKITKIGKDLIQVSEDNLNKENKDLNLDKKIHLIKLKFESPTKEKILAILDLYPNTNRFIVSDNVKTYNDILKNTNKKYYIQNSIGQSGIISFFRKNNKVLLSIPSLEKEERNFILNYAFNDILRNLEIIIIENKDYETKIDNFKNWKGNCIIFEKEHSYIL